MVHLISLKMQGIRSIGADPHAIEFLQPLTLIQGPNGTGKTTIIEALNFVTSGSLPAGKLATFVHDPKVANKTRVDGMVQLKFEDVKGHEVTGTKRVTSSVSKTIAGVTTKSDESTLRAMKDGKETSISSKISDYNAEVMTRLGVNKAVLDYVIFCHQEESNWPLSESKKLKERFDEIFEVSEYVEIMENVKTERKVLDKKVVDLENEIQNHLQGYVQRSNDLQNEIAKSKNDQETIAENLKKLDEKLERLAKQISECTAKKKNFDELKSAIDIQKATVRGKEENLENVDVPDYNGNIEELRKELDEAESKKDYQEVKKKQEEYDKEIARIGVEMKNITLEIAKVQRKINDLEVQKQRKRDIEKDRDALIEKIKSEYLIDADEDIEEAMEKIKKEKEAQKQDITNSSKAEIDQISHDLSAANVAIANVEATNRSKEADISRLKREILKIDKDIEQIGASAERSSKLEKEIAKLESKLSGEESLEVLEKQLLDRQVAISKTKIELEEYSRIITAEHDCIKKTDELNTVMKKSANLLSELFETPIQKNFNRQLTTLKMDLEKNCSIADKSYITLERETAKITDKLNKLKIKNEMNDSTVKQNQEQISQMGVEPDEVKDKLDKIRMDLKEYRDQLGEKQGSQFLYKKWEEQIAKEKNCPLCEKACGSATDVQKLVTKVKKRHADLPSEIDELTESVAKFEIQERNLTQVLPLVEKIETLLNQTSEEMEEINKIENEKASKEKEKEAAKKRLDDARKKLDAAKNLLGDAKLLDKLIEDQKVAKENVEEARQQLFDDEVDKTEWTLEQFEEARDEAQGKMETFEAEAKKANLKVKELRAKTADLQKLKEEKLKIGEKALQPAILTKSKEEKEARIQECRDEISACDEQIPDLKKNQKKLKADLDKANAELDSKKSEINTFLNGFLQLSQSFKNLNTRLSEIVLDENDQTELVEKMEGFTERKSELERKKVQYETEKTNVSNKQQKVRILRDQLMKKNLVNDIATLNGELMELQEQLEGLSGVEKELRDCQHKYSNTNNQRQAMKGRQQPLQDAIKKAEKQLLEPNIHNSVENFRDKYSEKCLSEEMSKDLDTYIKCLDGAIIAFHSLKMERINIILQELWSTVYDGNDIEAIRIKSDPVSGSDKRKSYNYSVVMIVDGKELEMRDRCSAGQKVLASILIRIALAEVFATNCPILALDEPTTNLDTDKIDNIGHMLTRLLQVRDDHLQLIVITHDVQLVRLLHLSCRPEYVYGLSKNEYGISKLKRHTKLGDTQDIN